MRSAPADVENNKDTIDIRKHVYTYVCGTGKSRCFHLLYRVVDGRAVRVAQRVEYFI